MMKFGDGGCWMCGTGGVYRNSPEGDELPFEYWNGDWGYWISSYGAGPRPHTPCEDPSKPEWRSAGEALKWAFENLGQAVEFDGPYVPRRFFSYYAGHPTLEMRRGTEPGVWHCCDQWPAHARARPLDGEW